MYESSRLKRRRQRLGYEQPIDYRERRQATIRNLEKRLSYAGVEVPEQPKQPPGTGTRILRAISAPGRYFAGVVSEATDRRPGIDLSKVREKARSRNFTYGFKDVLAEHGKTGKGAAVAGFVGDVVLDPLNLVTGGLGGAARQALKLGYKVGPKLGTAGAKGLQIAPKSVVNIAQRRTNLLGQWVPIAEDRKLGVVAQGLPIKEEGDRLLTRRLPDLLRLPLATTPRPEQVMQARVTLGRRRLAQEAARDKGGLKFMGQTVIPGATLKAPLKALGKVPLIQKAGQAIAGTGTYQDLANAGQAARRLFSKTAAVEEATKRYAEALGKHAPELQQLSVLAGKRIDTLNPLRMAQWIVNEYAKHRNLSQAEAEEWTRGVHKIFGGYSVDDAKKVLHALEGHALQIPPTERIAELRKLVNEREQQMMADLASGYGEGVQGVENVYDAIRQRGGIAIHPQHAFYTEWVQSVPRNVRQQLARAQGIPLDEMANELGMSARELIEALASNRPLTKKGRAAELQDLERFRKDARRYLEVYDPEYKKALDELWDLETEALEGVVRASDERLVPLARQARDLLRRIGEREVATGLLPHMIENYAPHIRNPKVRLTNADKVKLTEAFGHEVAQNLVSDDPSDQVKGIAAIFTRERLTAPAAGTKPGQLGMGTKSEPVNQSPDVARLFNPHAQQRQIRATVKEINKLVGKEFFTEDAAVALAVRGVRSIQAEHAYQFTIAALAKWGLTVDPETLLKYANKIPRGFNAYRVSVEPNGRVSLLRLSPADVQILQSAELTRRTLKSATGMEPLPAFHVPMIAVLPDEFAGVLNRMHRAFFGDEDFQKMLGWYDRFLAWWRGNATVARLGYHVRNVRGNLWNNWLAGIGPQHAGFYTLAARLQFNPQMVLDTPIGRLTRDQLWRLMTELGVVGTTFAGAELGRHGYRAIEAAVGRGRGNLNPLSTQFIWTRAGRAVGVTLEDNAKIAHFLAKLWEYRDPAAAAASVRRFLFDYFAVTDFERNVMKRVWPFYIWLSRNIPLQLEMLVRAPGKAAKEQDMQALSYNLTGQEAPPPEEQPSWMQGMIPWRIGQDGTQQTYFNTAPPLADVGLLATHEGSPLQNMQETTRNVISAMSPVIRMPFEIGSNRSFYAYPQQAFAERPGDYAGSFGRYLLGQAPFFKGVADAIAPPKPETPLVDRLLAAAGLKPIRFDTGEVAEDREREYEALLQGARRAAEEQGIDVPSIREIEKSGYVSERLKRRRKRLGY